MSGCDDVDLTPTEKIESLHLTMCLLLSLNRGYRAKQYAIQLVREGKKELKKRGYNE